MMLVLRLAHMRLASEHCIYIYAPDYLPPSASALVPCEARAEDG